MTTPSTRFLIAGATGNTGATTTRLLLQSGHAVTALVRRDDERSRALAAAGADVVVADLLDLRSVREAFAGSNAEAGKVAAGVQGAYFTYPVAPGLLDALVNFAQAAAEAQVRSVVNMSQISARAEAASDAARQHWVGERLLERYPFTVTHLRPTFFAEWLLWGWRPQDEVKGQGEGHGQGGVLTLPFGGGRHAPIAGVDQAHVIAALLQAPDEHAGASYTLVGPEEMDHWEIAEKMASALGSPVRYEPSSIEDFQDGLRARGLDEHFVQHVGSVARDYRDGVFAGSNDLIQRLSGRQPLTVEQFTRAHRDDLHRLGQFALAGRE
ncbi:uncharacterized protein YbjT (DUF2867 family) [Kineococcus radiotolerans]|uniref:Uncharacterized protein YbjT (DUF2867 family) n=1 Tax=Kineococcus radiotolerans TaxID=131568 RepID=A0A7W4TQQ7_KINRA|nr:NAD(P)H-binding protein [Kineococcus radiotolerans]MBB2903366.1 uncharacterized protein YbjT (DUF2867 family) [Kineococcus radiotolerans]